MSAQRRPRRGPAEPPDPDDPTRKREPAPLKPLLESFASRRGWDRRLEGARIHEVWEEIAGAALAAHTDPVRLHGGVLVVRVASSTWATQVRYLSSDLVERANAVLGADQVHSVTVVTGVDEGRGGRSRTGR